VQLALFALFAVALDPRGEAVFCIAVLLCSVCIGVSVSETDRQTDFVLLPCTVCTGGWCWGGARDGGVLTLQLCFCYPAWLSQLRGQIYELCEEELVSLTRILRILMASCSLGEDWACGCV